MPAWNVSGIFTSQNFYTSVPKRGHASPMPWMVVPKYPMWFHSILRLLMLIVAGFSAYWLIRGTIVVLRGLHVS